AAGEPVVLDDPVPVVAYLTAAAESGPQRVRREGPVERRPPLRKHRDVGIDDLEGVVRTHRAVRVGRRPAGRVRPEALPDAVEAPRRRPGPPRPPPPPCAPPPPTPLCGRRPSPRAARRGRANFFFSFRSLTSTIGAGVMPASGAETSE